MALKPYYCGDSLCLLYELNVRSHDGLIKIKVNNEMEGAKKTFFGITVFLFSSSLTSRKIPNSEVIGTRNSENTHTLKKHTSK